MGNQKTNQGFSRKVILSFDNFASFPTEGKKDNLYYDTATGKMYYWNGTEYKVWAENIEILLTTQPTPTATGNTTNLNKIFKDASGTTWFVDSTGKAISMGSAQIVTDFTAITNGFRFTNEENENDDVTFEINSTNPLNTKVEVKLNGVKVAEFPLYTVNNDIQINNSGSEWDLTDDKITIVETNGDSQTINFPYRVTVVANPNGSIDIKQNGVIIGTIPAPNIFKELKQFHVDKNGSNATGTGADEAPFLTITKALQTATQADVVIVNEGVYAEAVTLATQNQTLRGQGQEYGGLTEIQSLNATANGTSVRASSLTVTGNVTHSGSSPLYLSEMTVIGNYTSSTTAYSEIKQSRLQDGTISKTASGVLFITDSLIGNATFSTPNSVISLRNVTIDVGDTVTIGAGVIYSMQDVVGNVVINAGAIPLETIILAQGGTAEIAKAGQTSSFNMLRMLDPDTNASPTKYVTFNETTKRLEVSNLPATGAPVTVGVNPPTGTAIEGAIHLVTDDGTPTGTVLEQYIYDTESGVWIEMQRNAQDTLKFGTASPTANGEWDGEEYFVTSNGQSTGTVLEQWIWDKQSTTWVKRPAGSTANWTTAITDPTATGNTGTLPRFVENTVNGSKWYIDSTGKASLIEGAADGCGTVYFDSATPATATIFDDENPPITDDPALKNLDCAIYISAVDGSVWSSDGTTYKTKVYSYPLHQRDVINATASQTSFTLTKTPIGGTEKVHVTRNGVDISRAFTWVGAVGTYNPANNYNCTIDAGDLLQFHYEAL